MKNLALWAMLFMQFCFIQAQVEIDTAHVWKLYKSAEGSFEIKLPGTPEKNNVSTPIRGKGGMLSRVIFSKDTVSGIQYFIEYYDCKGLVFTSDSMFFETSLRGFRNLHNLLRKSDDSIEQDNFTGKDVHYSWTGQSRFHHLVNTVI